jgi:hypothetical protein
MIGWWLFISAEECHVFPHGLKSRAQRLGRRSLVAFAVRNPYSWKCELSKRDKGSNGRSGKPRKARFGCRWPQELNVPIACAPNPCENQPAKRSKPERRLPASDSRCHLEEAERQCLVQQNLRLSGWCFLPLPGQESRRSCAGCRGKNQPIDGHVGQTARGKRATGLDAGCCEPHGERTRARGAVSCPRAPRVGPVRPWRTPARTRESTPVSEALSPHDTARAVLPVLVRPLLLLSYSLPVSC